MGEEVGAPIQHPDIDKPRQRVQRTTPSVCFHAALEILIGGRMKAIEAVNPTRRGEFCGPDDVELKNVGIGSSCVQPLHVELMSLIGGIGGGAKSDSDRWVLRLKAIELPADDIA